MSHIKYWIWLSSLYGLRPKTKVTLFENFESADEIYFATKAKYMMVDAVTASEIIPLLNKNMDEAKRIAACCADNDISIITIQDAAYPERLRNIYDPPAVLFVKGRLPALDEEAAISVIGTRRATPYGLKMARKLGFEISKSGGLVVSGLTSGIDSAAAQGALTAGHGCVGILGTAINEVYPKSSRGLFEDVAAAGALISEYPPGFQTVKSNFRERNRILSGVSVGVAVVEAPENSGALLTAALALDQGRDLFVVPGNADSKSSEGSNELLKDSAKIVTCGWDVLCEYEGLFPERLKNVSAYNEVSLYKDTDLKADGAPSGGEQGGEDSPITEAGFEKLRFPSLKKLIDNKKIGEYIDLDKQLEGLSETQLKIVSVMSAPCMHVDDIIDLSCLPASTVLSDLTMMQISGFVIQDKGKRFSLNIKTKRG